MRLLQAGPKLRPVLCTCLEKRKGAEMLGSVCLHGGWSLDATGDTQSPSRARGKPPKSWWARVLPPSQQDVVEQ